MPLVELRTVHQLRYYTDSNGYAAVREPELMDQTVFFHVESHGYEWPADGFGVRGKALQVTPGGEITLRIKRKNIAERLYRQTGGGIYADSLLLGKPTPLRHPALNAQVLGCDSVVTAVYRGRLYWFWGDTNYPHYPLGLFHVPGATSKLPRDGGLEPSRGVDFEYFVDKSGRARATAQMSGAGPTWINGLIVLPDESGRERLLGAYEKVRNELDVYRRGLIEFDDEQQRFERVSDYAPDVPLRPHGHPIKRTADGVEWVYFGDPFLTTRVRATRAAWQDLAQYEGYTALKEGSTESQPQLDRDEAGRLRFTWRRGAAPWTNTLEAKLVKSGALKEDESIFRPRDVDSSHIVNVHRGTINWNEHRKRWIMICSELGGTTSLLGETWYSESDQPEGPWRRAKKIVTHDHYSFYNPKHHVQFDEAGGRFIYFEGTYTQLFSGRKPAEFTPRYEYNQILYRLDLNAVGEMK